MIPEEFIERLKNSTNMVAFAKQYTELKKVSPNIWQGKCPHPKHNENAPSFTVWQKENSWACYGCHTGKKNSDGNTGSDIFAFVQWLLNKNFKEAVGIVADWNNVSVPEDHNQKIYIYNYNQSMKYKKDLYNNIDALEYLASRGLYKEDIEKYLIGYDKYSNRIVFPLLDKCNNIVGFNRRIATNNYNKGDKYINSKASKVFNKSVYLYGLANLDNDCDEIRITEGSLDVILADKFGLKNVVASLGTAFTEQHAEVIKKLGKTPVLIFDGDDAGDKGLNNAISYFDSLGVYCKVVTLPRGKDLANIAVEKQYDLESYINNKAITSGYKKIQDVVAAYNSNLYELRLEFAPKLEGIIELVPGVEKNKIKSFIKDEINITIGD